MTDQPGYNLHVELNPIGAADLAYLQNLLGGDTVRATIHHALSVAANLYRSARDVPDTVLVPVPHIPEETK